MVWIVQLLGASRGKRVAILAASLVLSAAGRAEAHHEALFGPQSSLAVESEAFTSLQVHEHATGSGASYEREATFILSGGVTPLAAIPWTISVVLPVTYDYARTPAGLRSGPFSSCRGCFSPENILLSTSYRFPFKALERATGKDGNFALLSASIEPPTGAKDYAPLRGPTNYLFASMLGFEWRQVAAVALGYYRVNAIDYQDSKKGNNALAALGFSYSPVDEQDRILSLQIGFAGELHERDVLGGAPVAASGGAEFFASPTVLWGPSKHLRFFLYGSIPIAQSYRSVAQEDRWRAGTGVIYSFDRTPSGSAAESKTGSAAP
jgi:hypothetical protein